MTKRIIIFLLAAMVAMATLSSFAQDNTGTVKGKVTDEKGKPITNGTVVFIGKDGKKSEIKTDKNGEFVKTGLATGSYKVQLQVGGEPKWESGQDLMVNAGDQNPPFLIDMAATAAASKMTDEQRKQIEEQQKKAEAERSKIKNINAKLIEAKGMMEAGNIDGALSIYQQCVQTDATKDLLWAKLGEAYTAKANKTADKTESAGLAAKGVDALQKAIAIKPDAKYHNNLGQAFAAEGKTDDAVREYTQAGQQDSANAAMYYFNAGAVLTNVAMRATGPDQKKKLDDANEMFRKSSAANPNYSSGEAYYQLATNLLNQATMKDNKMIVPDGTTQAYQKYLEISPNGRYAELAKQTLAALGETVETTYKAKSSGKDKKK